MRIAPANQIALLMQLKRRIKLGCSEDDEFGGGAGGAQRGARSGQRLLCAAVRAEHVVGRDAPAAETAVDHLDGGRLSVIAPHRPWRRAIADLSHAKLLQMRLQYV